MKTVDYHSFSTLKMDGINYNVITVEPSPLFENLAMNDYQNATIVVVKQKPAIYLQAVWHEILHHISNYRMNDELTEAQIDALATGINATLLDNPNLTMEIWQTAETGEFTAEIDEDCDYEELEIEL